MGSWIRTRLSSAPAWIWIAVFLSLGISIFLVFWARSNLPAAQRSDVWLEVAKAGVQLGVIAVLGGLVTLALRSVDAAREDRRRLREYRLSILHDLLASYNGIKTARRILRAFGFRMPTSGRLSAEQIAEYRAQSRSLIEIQLSLEKIVRELEARPDLFADSDDLRAALGDAGDYVHDVGKEWEENGAWLKEGVQAAKLANLRALQGFLRTRDTDFDQRVSKPIASALKTMGGQL